MNAERICLFIAPKPKALVFLDRNRRAEGLPSCGARWQSSNVASVARQSHYRNFLSIRAIGMAVKGDAKNAELSICAAIIVRQSISRGIERICVVGKRPTGKSVEGMNAVIVRPIQKNAENQLVAGGRPIQKRPKRKIAFTAGPIQKKSRRKSAVAVPANLLPLVVDSPLLSLSHYVRDMAIVACAVGEAMCH